MKAIREVTNHGQTRYLVDLREIGRGRFFFETEAKARRFQAEALQEQEKYGKLAWDLPHETRVRYLAAETRLAELGATIDQAIDHWERTHHPSVQKPIGEAVKECLEAKRKANKRPRYLEQLGYSLEKLAASVGVETNCSAVTLEQIDAWLANPDWEPRTKKGHLINARTFFSFCRKRGWAPVDPCAAVEPILVDSKRPGILSVHQVERLFTFCLQDEPRLLPWLVLGIFTGVRPDEIKQLTWSHIKLGAALVDVPPEISKVRRRGRYIPLQPVALKWMKLAKKLHGDLPPTNWRRRWIRVREAAGFVLEKSPEKEGEAWPHDAMRHTFCSYSCPIFGTSKTADWHGDSEQTMIDHYRERVTEADANAFWKLAPPG